MSQQRRADKQEILDVVEIQNSTQPHSTDNEVNDTCEIISAHSGEEFPEKETLSASKSEHPVSDGSSLAAPDTAPAEIPIEKFDIRNDFSDEDPSIRISVNSPLNIEQALGVGEALASVRYRKNLEELAM